MRCACCGSSAWRPNAWRFPAASWTISAGTGGSPPPPLALSLAAAPAWVLPSPPRPSSVPPPHSRVPLCAPASALHQSQVSALSPGLGSPSLAPGPSLTPALVLSCYRVLLCSPGLSSSPIPGSFAPPPRFCPPHWVPLCDPGLALFCPRVLCGPGLGSPLRSRVPLYTPSLLVSDAPSVPELFLFLFPSVPPPWGTGIPHFYLLVLVCLFLQVNLLSPNMNP